eukprot:3456771-Rhodomonas_salina.1
MRTEWHPASARSTHSHLKPFSKSIRANTRAQSPLPPYKPLVRPNTLTTVHQEQRKQCRMLQRRRWDRPSSRLQRPDRGGSHAPLLRG